MQIQRIQSLYLLIAAVFTGIFCFMPYASVSVSDAQVSDLLVSESPVMLVLNITITVLLLITIFMYNNLRLQIKMAAIDIALICGSIITTIVYAFAGENAAVAYGGLAMLILALGFAIAGRRGMVRDKEKLASADRLR